MIVVCFHSINAQSFNSEMPDHSKPRRHYNPIIPEVSSNKQVNITHSSFSQNININCPPNIDFEEGNFNNWRCDTGFVQGVNGFDPITGQQFISVFGQSPTGINQALMTSSMPMNNRHTIIQNLGGASPLDPYGLFPIYPPNGSSFAIKLGSDLDFPNEGWPGARSERITYTINVPNNASDFSLIYNYAVVFQDPGHFSQNQPRFNVNLFDPLTNTNVPCGFVEYVADSTIPGFERSTLDPSVWYKAWAPVFINLSRYAGHTLYLQFTTEDCAQGGHWGYAYVDVNGCELTVKAKNNCDLPPRTILSGPDGFATYNWWNSNFTQLLATGQNATSNVSLAFNDIVHLEVVPRSGVSCRDTITTTVTKDTLIYPSASDKTICKDSNVVIGAGVLVNNYTYQWSSNTNISTTNQASVSVHTNTNTDYNLIVTDTVSKCKFFDTLKVIVFPDPIVSVAPTGSLNICQGSTIQLNATVQSGNIQPSSFQWYFNNAVMPGETQPNITASQSGDYKVIFTNGNGCSSYSQISSVIVNPLPQANINLPSQDFICDMQPLILSTSYAGLSYQWFFNGNIIPNSNQASYNATLSGNYTLQVTSNAGCTNLASGVISLKKYKKPIVDFEYNSGCNATINFNNHSDTSMSGQVNWLWNFGDGTQSTDYNPTHNYISGNNYSVSLSATSIKCPNLYSASSQIVIVPLNPSGIRYRTVDALINTNTLLEARLGASSYLWSPSTGLSATTGSTLSVNPVSTTVYSIIK